MPIVSYWRWTLSARSSKSLTMEGFSRDMAGLRPERTSADHVTVMQSQSCRLARQTPPWFPNRQYRAPWQHNYRLLCMYYIIMLLNLAYLSSTSAQIFGNPAQILSLSLNGQNYFLKKEICENCIVHASVYLKLLLGDIGPVWLQQLQHLRSDVSTAEVISSQSSEQNTLSLTADLVANKVFRTTFKSGKDMVISKRIFIISPVYLTVGAGGQTQKVSEQILVNSFVFTAIH